MRRSLISKLTELALKDDRIHVILPDIGVFAFKQAGFPDKQLHNVGICEQAGIDICAGLALTGKVPFFYTIAPFATTRCFEQIKMACYNNLPIKVVGVGAGLSYSHEGPTHHSCEDIGIMRLLPEMYVYSPCSSEETTLITQEMVNNCKPSYIRLTANPSSNINYSMQEFLPFMRAQYSINAKVAIITTGSILDNVLAALEQPVIGQYDERFSVYSMSQLWPVTLSDKGPDMLAVLKGHKTIITVEEHSIGGLASIISEIIAQNRINAALYPLTIPSDFCPVYGSYDEVLDWAGLSIDKIREKLECLALL